MKKTNFWLIGGVLMLTVSSLWFAACASGGSKAASTGSASGVAKQAGSGTTAQAEKRGLAVEGLPQTNADIEVFPQVGHQDIIGVTVTFSPDGKLIATSHPYETFVKLWDTTALREFRTLAGHKNSVTCVAFSPDGKLIASGSDDKTVKLWDTATWREIRTLITAHRYKLRKIAFSPDGKQIVTSDDVGYQPTPDRNGTIKVWDVTSGREIRSFSTGSSRVFDITFSPDGKQIVSGEEKTVQLWDIASGKLIRTLMEFERNGGNRVAFSPNGKLFAAVGGSDSNKDDVLKIWDTATWREILDLKHVTGGGFVAFSPDGKRFVGTNGLYDTATGTRIWAASNSIRALSPDGKLIFQYGNGLIDSASGQMIGVFRGNTVKVNSVAFSPDGKLSANGSDDGTVKLWDTVTGRLLFIFKAEQRYVTVKSVAFSPDGKQIVFRDMGNKLKIWDVATGRPIHTFTGHEEEVNSVAFSPDGKLIASGAGQRSHTTDRDNTVKIWDAASGRLIHTLTTENSDATVSVAFSPDGKLIAAGIWDKFSRTGADGTIRLWDTATGKELRTIKTDWSMYSIAFNPNGKQIAAALPAETRVWDIETGQEIKRERGEGMGHAVAYSPDGKQIATGDIHGNIRVWDASTGKAIHNFKYGSSIQSIAFNPDGKQIITGTGSSVFILDASTGKGIAQFVSFSGTDTQLAAASRGLTVENQTAAASIDGEWLSITPDGYYNASPQGDRYINVRVNNTVSGIDAYRSIFYNPDVVLARLQGRPDPASKASATIQQAANFTPPEVAIQSPANGSATNTATTNLSVNIASQSQPVKNIKIIVSQCNRNVPCFRSVEMTPCIQ